MVAVAMAAAAREGRQAARRPRDEAEELALLLVRDWLERSAFHSTVQAFDIESVRLDRPAPPRSKREALLELLQHAVPDADRHATVPILRALLESLLAQSLGFSKKLTAPPQPPRQQTTILMSKKKAVDADLRVVKKSTLSRARGAASTPQFTTQPSPNNRPDSGFRPKSAVTCRSTPELVSLSGSQPGVKRPLRPISAASTLPHRTNPSDSPYNIQPGSPTQLGAVPETPETRSPKLDKSISRATSLRVINGPSTRHFSNIAIAPLPQITETNITIGADESDDEKPKETEPALLLEEMSEELLMSQYSSLSKEAIKTIRRVRAKSNAYNQEFVKSKRTIGKIQAREKQRQLRRVIAAEQTELLSSAMDGLTKEPCGLCEFVFPKKSLIMKVTYKAIFDLRAKWSAAASSPSGEVHLRSLPLSGSNRKRPGSDSGDEREEAGDAGDRSQIAHYYDEVPICVFCKQLVLDVSFYRPSSAELRARQAETARMAVEAHQLKEAARIRALNRCDPLDFNAFELNSDDGDSDTEELLVLDADGRPRVVRRKNTAKAKVVANRGLVGKHLHYNQLRSESVHRLNNKEWQQITS